jgi:hypothetical protein
LFVLAHFAIALSETRIPIFFARIPAPFSTVLVVFVKYRVFYIFATAMAMGLVVKRLLHRNIVLFSVARQLYLFFCGILAKQSRFWLHFKMPVAGSAKQLAVNHISIFPIVVVCAKGALKGFLFFCLECRLGIFTAKFKCARVAIDGVIVSVVLAFFGTTITTSSVLGIVATRSCIYRKAQKVIAKFTYSIIVG